MNDMAQSILTWGGIAGALVAIIALASKIVGVVRNAKTYFSDLKTNVDTLVEHDRTQYLAILRLTVMADNLPLSERIAAGKEYIKSDGNGDVKAYYETVLKPHDTIINNKEAS